MMARTTVTFLMVVLLVRSRFPTESVSPYVVWAFTNSYYTQSP